MPDRSQSRMQRLCSHDMCLTVTGGLAALEIFNCGIVLFALSQTGFAHPAGAPLLGIQLVVLIIMFPLWFLLTAGGQLFGRKSFLTYALLNLLRIAWILGLYLGGKDNFNKDMASVITIYMIISVLMMLACVVWAIQPPVFADHSQTEQKLMEDEEAWDPDFDKELKTIQKT